MWTLVVATIVGVQGSLVRIETADSLGSGVRISFAHVLTNQHVVSDTQVVAVNCAGTLLRARVVAAEASVDLALLELLRPAACDTSVATMRALGALAGEPLFIKACPRGQCQVAPKGEVVARTIIGGEDRLLTTLYVRPGSSGGPVYDDEGEVVGMARAYAEVDEGYLGQLIPVDQMISFVLRSCRRHEGLPLTLRVSHATGTHFCPSSDSALATR